MLAAFVGGLLFVDVAFQGTPIRCLVDTAAVQSVVDVSAFGWLLASGSVAGDAQPVRSVWLVGVGGEGRVQPVQVPIYRARNIGIPDAFGWPLVDVAVVPEGWMGQPCILGTDVLARQPVTIDWLAGTLRPATTLQTAAASA